MTRLNWDESVPFALGFKWNSYLCAQVTSNGLRMLNWLNQWACARTYSLSSNLSFLRILSECPDSPATS
ncbi:hypothetical protein BDV28DRAFT_137901 [Aspergillus coremiiformis]|uniref:Uncharacterized protein n=1 Tax=Aspergillus coremiiformis TaxID=138285 RepID=A0A5N6Z093_9EURO|nr:hypothetical protein BDV28DRAFT_137901 [Aspergillus coremiiformis]